MAADHPTRMRAFGTASRGPSSRLCPASVGADDVLSIGASLSLPSGSSSIGRGWVAGAISAPGSGGGGEETTGRTADSGASPPTPRVGPGARFASGTKSLGAVPASSPHPGNDATGACQTHRSRGRPAGPVVVLASTDVTPSPGCRAPYTGKTLEVVAPHESAAIRKPFRGSFCDLVVGPVLSTPTPSPTVPERLTAANGCSERLAYRDRMQQPRGEPGDGGGVPPHRADADNRSPNRARESAWTPAGLLPWHDAHVSHAGHMSRSKSLTAVPERRSRRSPGDFSEVVMGDEQPQQHDHRIDQLTLGPATQDSPARSAQREILRRTERKALTNRPVRSRGSPQPGDSGRFRSTVPKSRRGEVELAVDRAGRIVAVSDRLPMRRFSRGTPVSNPPGGRAVDCLPTVTRLTNAAEARLRQAGSPAPGQAPALSTFTILGVAEATRAVPTIGARAVRTW